MSVRQEDVGVDTLDGHMLASKVSLAHNPPSTPPQHPLLPDLHLLPRDLPELNLLKSHLWALLRVYHCQLSVPLPDLCLQLLDCGTSLS